MTLILRGNLNSLSSEPSHSARFVAILMYSYLWMQDLLFGRQVAWGESVKKHTGIWLAFFWVMLTSGSGTAIMLLGIIFLQLYKRAICFAHDITCCTLNVCITHGGI